MTMTSTDTAIETEPWPVATSPVTHLRGQLPRRPARFADTPIVHRVAIATNTAVRARRIAAISGPPGLGKTTAAAEAARRLGSQAVYLLMPDTPSVLSSLVIIWEALTHTTPAKRERQVKDDIVRHLLLHDITLIIDDAHYVKPRGLRVLGGIWNELDVARGSGVPIVLIGNALSEALLAVPEMNSRINARFEVVPLGGDALWDALHTIEPRTSHTNPKLLRALDNRHFRGELRQWVQLFEILALQDQDASPTSAITKEEIGEALIRMGRVA